MPQKLTFTKVVVKSFSRNPTGGTAKISASPSKSVHKIMGWGDMPDWEKASNLTGKLSASVVEFEPGDSTLVKHAFQLEGAGSVRDFVFVRTQIKSGKTAKKAPKSKVELQFAVDFTDANGGRKLETYMQAANHESTMTVTYEKEAEQEELVLDEDRRQSTLKESD